MQTQAPDTSISVVSNGGPKISHKRKGGPKTDDGKKRTRFNALRHGLTGRTVVMPWEDCAAYEAFCQRMMQCLKPVGEDEMQLAQNIADCHWKLGRAGVAETNLFVSQHHEMEGTVNTGDEEIDTAIILGTAFRKESHTMANIALYCNRIENLRSKARRELNALQAQRKEQEQKEMRKAAQLLKSHRTKKIELKPAEYGFEFSVAEIEGFEQRQQRWEAAELFGDPPARPGVWTIAA